MSTHINGKRLFTFCCQNSNKQNEPFSFVWVDSIGSRLSCQREIAFADRFLLRTSMPLATATDGECVSQSSFRFHVVRLALYARFSVLAANISSGFTVRGRIFC